MLRARPSTRMHAIRFLLLLLLLAALLPIGSSQPRILVPGDIALPEGFQIEVVVDDLDAPTMVTFDDEGRMIIAESGYGEAGAPKVTRIETNGDRTVLASGDVFDVPLTAVYHENGTLYAVDADTVFRFSADGAPEPILEDLPGLGDHQANQIVIQDDTLFVAVGSVTNAAVVGYDNWVFGWLRMPERRNLTEVPCEDIELVGQSFRSEDPINGGETNTSAYAPFGTTYEPGHVVEGNVRCNGAVLALDLNHVPLPIDEGLGREALRVHAWGLRNPYGLTEGPDGALYATNHGFDARGSRYIENTWDCLYRIEEGAWYGYPDFACEVPVTDPRFQVEGQPPVEFLLADHPDPSPPTPLARFDSHAATNGLTFSPGGDWGPRTDAFIALFGDMAPATGTVPHPQGFKIARVDTTDGEVVDFITNKVQGRASRAGAGGFEHPSDVTFGPDGAMYITDWGIADITGEGLKLHGGSGVVWKVSRTDGEAGRSVSPPEAGVSGASGLGVTTAIWAVVTVALFAGAVLVSRGAERVGAVRGLVAGLVGGLVLGLAAILVGVVVYDLPWFAAPRIMAAMFMGRDAQTDILHFDAASLIVGLLVVLLLTGGFGLLYGLIARTDVPPKLVGGAVLWGLAGWALLQFLVWPLFFPLINDKAFPPVWFAAAFFLYGLTLGLGLYYWPRLAQRVTPRSTET